jgi:hypothetical protein
MYFIKASRTVKGKNVSFAVIPGRRRIAIC